jgi:hypothetical protein
MISNRGGKKGQAFLLVDGPTAACVFHGFLLCPRERSIPISKGHPRGCSPVVIAIAALCAHLLQGIICCQKTRSKSEQIGAVVVPLFPSHEAGKWGRGCLPRKVGYAACSVSLRSIALPSYSHVSRSSADALGRAVIYSGPPRGRRGQGEMVNGPEIESVRRGEAAWDEGREASPRYSRCSPSSHTSPSPSRLSTHAPSPASSCLAHRFQAFPPRRLLDPSATRLHRRLLRLYALHNYLDPAAEWTTRPPSPRSAAREPSRRRHKRAPTES